MYEIRGQVISLIAGEEIDEAKLFKPVFMSGDNTCKVSEPGPEAKYIGYVQNVGKLGEAVPVMINGVTMFKATGSVKVGTAVDGGAIALKAASGAGEVIPVKIV